MQGLIINIPEANMKLLEECNFKGNSQKMGESFFQSASVFVTFQTPGYTSQLCPIDLGGLPQISRRCFTTM